MCSISHSFRSKPPPSGNSRHICVLPPLNSPCTEWQPVRAELARVTKGEGCRCRGVINGSARFLWAGPKEKEIENTKKPQNKTALRSRDVSTSYPNKRHENEMGRLACLSLCCLLVALISLAQAVDLRGVHPSGTAQKSRTLEGGGLLVSANAVPSSIQDSQCLINTWILL